MTNSTNVERGPLRARRALLTFTTALCTGLAVPALAQSPHPNLDANGVDLTDGSFNLRLPVASIGSGQAELPLIAYDGQNDNWSRLVATQTVSGATTNVSISLGPQFDNFTLTGASATSSRGTGATLSLGGDGSLTYRTLDGVVIEFGNPVEIQGGASNLCDATNNGSCTRLALSVTGKAGMTVALAWNVHSNCSTVFNPDGSLDCTYTWRLGNVSNEAGYAITWTYAGNTVPRGQNPAPVWFQRTSAALQRGGSTVSTVTYANPSTNVFTIATPGGKTWRITGSGQSITGVRRPSASTDTTMIAYASLGVVSSVTRDGVATTYGRSVSGVTATQTVTDAQSRTTTIVSDMSKHRPTSVTDPLNRTTTMAYDAIGRPTEITYPEGNKVQYGYDARGNVIETRLKTKPSVGGADIVTSAGYAASCTDASCNSPLWTKDANGAQTDYGYDTAMGLVTSVTAPAPAPGATRPETRVAYSDVAGTKVATSVSTCRTGGAPSCIGTADEVRRTIGYDANLAVTTNTIAAGDASVSATTTTAYDAQGNLVSVDGPLAGAADTTTFRWSPDRERLGAISADPDGAGALKRRALRTTHNADGLPTVSEVGTVNGTSDADWAAFVSVQQSTASYDGNARKVKDVLTAGGATYGVSQYSYDPVGRLECAAVRMNSSAWTSLPGSACTLQAAGPAGPDRITKATYDAAGQLTKTTSALGTPDQADDATATYTGNGLTRTLADANGNLTSYDYDGFDRLAKTRFPVGTAGANSSSGTDYEQLGYDPNGNVVSRRLRDGQVIGYGYDALSRLKLKDLPASEPDVTYGYDLLGRPTAAGTSAQSLSFSYDALGRNLGQSGPLGAVSSQYDVAGRRTRLTWADGFYVTYDHLVTGEVTAIRENGAASGAGVLATFGYDDLGRRVGVARGNGTTTTYAFDPASRLSTLGHDLVGSGDDLSLGLAYNPASQIASVTRSNDAYAWSGHSNRNTGYTVNGLNQATTAGPTAIGYDARGNTTAIGAAGYGYSSENLLLTGPSSASLAYDPLARLFQVSQSGTTRFQYDGLDMIGEFNGAGALQRRYVFGPGTNEPLVWYEGAGTADRRWLHADERGSVVAVTNGSGARLAANAYDEYGVPASTNSGRFGYTGQTWLPELGLWHYKARMYAPALGRFMQTDPIGYGDGMNWYGYVGGDPVNRTDPTGYQSDDVAVTGLTCGAGQTATPTRDGSNDDNWAYVCTGFDPLRLLTVRGLGSFMGDALSGGGGETPQSDQTTYLTNLQCNAAQNFVRKQGELTSSVGGAITAGGLTAGTISAGIGLGGALTGNLPAAFVGTVGGTASAAVTSFGGTLSFVGAVEQFAGGSSTKLIFRQVNNAVVDRLPLPSLAKGWIKEGLKKAESYVPDVRVCR